MLSNRNIFLGTVIGTAGLKAAGRNPRRTGLSILLYDGNGVGVVPVDIFYTDDGPVDPATMTRVRTLFIDGDAFEAFPIHRPYDGEVWIALRAPGGAFGVHVVETYDP